MTSLDPDLDSDIMSTYSDTVLGFRNVLAATAGATFFREFTKSKDANNAGEYFMAEGVPREGVPR